MPARATSSRADWTRGPAAWAPIALLTLLATIGAARATSTAPVDADFGAIASSPLTSVRLNINTATAAQLELLPRIGPALAQRIIEDRDANGPYKDAEDLQRVRGIGPRTAERIAAVADFVILR